MTREKTTHIVIHTAAWKGDPSAADIRRVHVEEFGWSEIGYHYIIRKDGTIEPGRQEHVIGAHCRDMGMNKRSVGICCSGHGDYEHYTEEQLDTLARAVNSLRATYDIPVANVIGHRETGAAKTCPGTLVDMDQLRDFIEDEFVGIPPVKKIETAPVSEPITAGPIKKASGESTKIADIAVPDKSRFKRFLGGLKRTFTGQSTTGKMMYGGLAGAVALLTGINLQPAFQTLQIQTLNSTVMELDFITLIIIAITGLITLAVSRGLISGVLNEIATEVKQALNATKKAREASSPGGKEITDAEQMLIFKEAEDAMNILWRRILKSRVLGFFGLNKTDKQ